MSWETTGDKPPMDKPAVALKKIEGRQEDRKNKYQEGWATV